MNTDNTKPETKAVEYQVNTNVRISESDVHYRGVFSISEIKKGDLIERCPMVPLSNRSRYQQDPTIWDYMYGHTDCPCQECKNHGFIFYMILGYGMIYNHHESPNSSWTFHYDHLYADLIAEVDIQKDQEVFVSYGRKYWESRQTKVDDAKNNQ